MHSGEEKDYRPSKVHEALGQLLKQMGQLTSTDLTVLTKKEYTLS